MAQAVPHNFKIKSGDFFKNLIRNNNIRKAYWKKLF